MQTLIWLLPSIDVGDSMDVIVSDLHMGSSSSVFSSSESKKIVNQFIKELKEMGPVEKLILLGDIFDFWDEKLSNILEKSAPFFEKIGGITKEIVYIPGNHDHHSLILCEEMENIENLEKRTNPFQKRTFRDILKYECPKKRNSDCKTAAFLKGLLPALEDTHVQLSYPEYTYNRKGKEILFRHGHYLDSGLFKVMPWLFKKLGGKIESEKDFEVVNTPIYEHLYWCGRIREFSNFYRKLHRIYKCSEKLYKRKSHRDIESRKRDVEAFFTRFKSEKNKYPDVFIFGHTHVAGTGYIYTDRGINHSMELFNSGSWTKEGDIDHFNTYITIDDDIAVREVGKGKI